MKPVFRYVVFSVLFVAISSLYAGPWDTNVLVNPGAEDGVNGWTMNPGDEWGIISTNSFGYAPHSGSYHFITSTELSTMSQEIDIIGSGFSEYEIVHYLTAIEVGNWIASAWGGSYFIRVELRDAAHAVLDSWNIGSESALQAIAESTPYFEVTHIFNPVSSNVRYVYFICGGTDNRGWAEWYGAEFDDAYVLLHTETLPVELSSFTASVTSENFVQLEWITQSETDMLGYNVLRGETSEAQSAICMNDTVIPAQNQSMETLYSFLDQDISQNSTYWYWLESIELDGQSNLHGPVNVTVVAPGTETPDTPEETLVTGIVRNFPNPFNPSTTILYSLAEEGDVDLAIYNCRGELVQTMSDHQSRGQHTYVWNGEDTAGNACASGVYFFRLRSNGVENITKGIMLK